jgi:hypothetical protein
MKYFLYIPHVLLLTLSCLARAAVPEDCSTILNRISGGKPAELVSEIKRGLSSQLRNAPIAGNQAHKHLPVVRHLALVGLSVRDDLRAVLMAIEAHYTERFIVKRNREETFLVQLDLNGPLREPFTEITDGRILKPDSLTSENGAILSGTLKSLVAKLIRFQANVLESAEELGLSQPHIRTMVHHMNDEGTLDYIRATVESLDHPTEKPIVFLATFDMDKFLIGELLREQVEGLPTEPGPPVPRKNAEHLFYDSEQSARQNIIRAVQTTMDDDQTHFGDEPPLVNFLGYSQGQHDDVIYVASADVLIYDETTVTMDYVVIVQPDRKMDVIRTIHFDAEGDAIRSPDDSEVRVIRHRLPGEIAKLFRRHESPNVNVISVQLIATAKSIPDKIIDRTMYINNNHYDIFRVIVEIMDFKTRERAKRPVLILTERRGDDLLSTSLVGE